MQIELKNYIQLLKTANTLERSSPSECYMLLNDVLAYILSHEAEFYEKFPNRKYDIENLKKRLGKVEAIIEKETQVLADIETLRSKIDEKYPEIEKLIDTHNFALAQKLLNSFRMQIRQLNSPKLAEYNLKIDQMFQRSMKRENELEDARNQILQSIQKFEDIKTHSTNYPYLIQLSEEIIHLAEKIHDDEIIKKFTDAAKIYSSNLLKAQQMQAKITKLLTSAQNTFKKGSIQATLQGYEKIYAELSTFLIEMKMIEENAG